MDSHDLLFDDLRGYEFRVFFNGGQYAAFVVTVAVVFVFVDQLV